MSKVTAVAGNYPLFLKEDKNTINQPNYNEKQQKPVKIVNL